MGGATLVGLVVSPATAQAEIEPGHYVAQALYYGFMPMPEFNVTVVGNDFQRDFYGLGPVQSGGSTITPTPDGGIIPIGSDPVSRWLIRYELHETPTGYFGTLIQYGVPMGNFILTDTPRRANQPG